MGCNALDEQLHVQDVGALACKRARGVFEYWSRIEGQSGRKLGERGRNEGRCGVGSDELVVVLGLHPESAHISAPVDSRGTVHFTLERRNRTARGPSWYGSFYFRKAK